MADQRMPGYIFALVVAIAGLVAIVLGFDHRFGRHQRRLLGMGGGLLGIGRLHGCSGGPPGRLS